MLKSLLGIWVCLSATTIGGEPAVQQAWAMHTIDKTSQGADGIRLFSDGGRLGIATPWEEGGTVRLYRRPATANVRQPWPAVTVGLIPSPEDACVADLDQDGQIDVISCSEGTTQQIRIAFGMPQRNRTELNSTWQLDPLPDDGPPQAWMYALPGQWDGHGGLDLMAGSKNHAATVSLWLAPEDVRQLSQWRRITLRDAGWIMSLIAHDMDQDGDADLILSDRRGPKRGVYWLENPGTDLIDTPSNWHEHLIGGQDVEVMFLTAANLDTDRDAEWICATLAGRIVVFDRPADTESPWLQRSIPLPSAYRRGKAVATGDLDDDERLDLVVTTEDGCVAWLADIGRIRNRESWTWQQVNGGRGYKFDQVELVDLDDDGDLDILSCEERRNLGVVWFENPR